MMTETERLQEQVILLQGQLASAQAQLRAVKNGRPMIQVGVTALRDPVTGDFLEPVNLYIRAEDQDKASAPPPGTFCDLARYLAGKMRDYMEGCQTEGVKV